MKTPDYDAQVQYEFMMKTRGILVQLPEFCNAFLMGLENTTSVRTRYGYAVDLLGFFTFLTSQIPRFQGREIISLTLADLDKITADDLEQYLSYVGMYLIDGELRENHERAKARKLSTLRSMFKYFFKREKISKNVAALPDMPKIHEKPIIRLEPDEVAKLLDAAEAGQSLTETQKRYHRLTCVRDVAILTLFLGTGIRISELVGVNLSDLNFEINGFRITRKGGNQVTLYFGEEVAKALREYIGLRNNIEPIEGHEDALFLSLRRRRITARAVQMLVDKYSRIAAPLKHISPHKLRSTYGTMLYQETGDIYLVADVLGHKDVNTTKKHYAALADEKRRQAARVIKLRDDE